MERHQERLKERYQIIEKNKKLASLKKPLAPVPVIDPLIKDEIEKSKIYLFYFIENYVYFKKNLKFINLMENAFAIEVVELLVNTISRAHELMFSLERNTIKFENLTRLRTLNGHKIIL